MKTVYLFAIFFLFATMGWTQLNNKGTIVIEDGATLYVEMDVVNDVGGTINNMGTLEVTGDLLNSAKIKSGSISKVIFSGSSNSMVDMGGDTLNDVEINKTGADLVLTGIAHVSGIWNFLSTNNQIILGDNHLIFGTGSITNAGFQNHFVTNGTGLLKKENLTNFTFPVGNSESSYNPVTLVESGTADHIGVKCLPQVLTDGDSGSPITNEVADVSWAITEDTPGGSDMSLTANWITGDESFGALNHNKIGISKNDGSGWDLTVNDPGFGAVTGSGTNGDPYQLTRTGITGFSHFAVGGEPIGNQLKLAIDVFLQGPYNGSDMNDNLRSLGSFPTSEPYQALGFAPQAFGGGESINSSILSTSGSDAIIDWLWVELRDPVTPTNILATKSAILQKDGDVVDLDGVSDLTISGLADGNYHVAVRHRNHLGIRTSSNFSLSNVVQVINLNSNLSNIQGGALGVTDLGGSIYGLVSGDFDGNGQIQNTDGTGIIPSIGLSGYLTSDIDLNSQVQNTDIQITTIPNLGKGAQYSY